MGSQELSPCLSIPCLVLQQGHFPCSDLQACQHRDVANLNMHLLDLRSEGQVFKDAIRERCLTTHLVTLGGFSKEKKSLKLIESGGN